MTKEIEHVEHRFAPLFNGRSRVLLLGTIPSPASRRAHFYYANPQNRFWRVLAGIFEEEVPQANQDRRAFLLDHHIALWDVLSACDIAGASDASIARPEPNQLSLIGNKAPLEHVFLTGSKAYDLYRRFSIDMLPGLPSTQLPSTSPANARMGLDELINAYAVIRQVLEKA